MNRWLTAWMIVVQLQASMAMIGLGFVTGRLQSLQAPTGHRVVAVAKVQAEPARQALRSAPSVQFEPASGAVIDLQQRPHGFVVCGGQLDVRSGPGEMYPVVAQLQAGDPAAVEEWGKGSGLGWARLSTLGGSGIQWVEAAGICG